MPEGPSIAYLKETLDEFVGRKLTMAGGYGKMEKAWLKGKKLLEIATWGKHLLLRFTGGTIRVHLMLFGSVKVNEKKKVNATLYLKFGKDTIYFYVVQAIRIEEPLKQVYDWRTDILHPRWNARLVRKLMKDKSDMVIGDLLMEQDIFTGVGNIIRNEVLYRARIHPASITGSIPEKKVTALLKEIRIFARQFLKEKRAGTFGDHLLVYEQKDCPKSHGTLRKGKVGKVPRKTYYCTRCQIKYD